MLWIYRSLGIVLLLLASGRPTAAVELSESADGDRQFRVTSKLTVAGKVLTAAVGGKSVALKLDATAELNYHERRLEGVGRDAQTLRALRRYDLAAAQIQVAEQASTPRLRESRTWIVALGQADGLQVFSPAGPLTSQEVELLHTPGDSLAALALLPDEPVDVEEQWKPAPWVLQFLTGVEAVEKSTLTCELKALDGDVARVEFTGQISGGILGGATEIQVAGHFLFDVPQGYVRHLELKQTEKRSLSAVTSGLDVTAEFQFDRAPAAESAAIKDGDLKGLKLDASPASLQLLLDVPEMKLRAYHHRQWNLFHQSPRVAVLRLVEKGSFVAQCNISPLPAARPGGHVDEKQFRLDVQQALGNDFEKIILSEVVPADDKRFIYRVVATGQSNFTDAADGDADKRPMQWIYYLIAAPDGRQAALVFTLEAQLLEKFGSQDVPIATGLEFLPK